MVVTETSERSNAEADAAHSARDGRAWRNWLILVLSLGAIASIVL